MKCTICEQSKQTKHRKGLEEVIATSKLPDLKKVKVKKGEGLEICDECYEEQFGVKAIRFAPVSTEDIQKALDEKEKREKEKKERV